jgi:hypothetical protein
MRWTAMGIVGRRLLDRRMPWFAGRFLHRGGLRWRGCGRRFPGFLHRRRRGFVRRLFHGRFGPGCMDPAAALG